MKKRTLVGSAIVNAILFFCLVSGASAASTAPISIVSPSGGEAFVVGQKQFIRLNDKTRLKSVSIELSRDAGTTFESLGTIDNTVKSSQNVLPFTVTGGPSSHCLIRATGAGVTGTTGEFTISAGSGSSSGGTVSAAAITSGSASSGFVLTADGLGAASFVPPGAVPGVSPAAGNNLITALNNSATTTTINTSLLPANVTLQGNAFNAANKLVQLDATGRLPATDGSQITNLNGSNISGGIITPGSLPIAGTTTATRGTIYADNTTIVVAADGKLSSVGGTPAPGSANYIQNQAATPQAANFNISGNGTVGGNLSVAGTLSIPTTTRYYSVHFSAFRLNVGEGAPTNATLTLTGGTASCFIQGSQPCQLFAPLNLPHGATITGFQTIGATVTSTSLLANGTTLATVAGTGSAVLSHQVDNQANRYSVSATCPQGTTTSIAGVMITYTVNQPLP